MVRRRFSPRRRSVRVAAIAALSVAAVCLSPHGGVVAPTTVLARKPMPTPTALPRPTGTAAPTAFPTPAPTPAPTAEPTEAPRPASTSTPVHHTARSLPAVAAQPTHPPMPSAAATGLATARAHAAASSHLKVQETSLPTTLASFAQNRRGELSPYVLGADILAAASVLFSLLLSELRRRRLV